MNCRSMQNVKILINGVSREVPDGTTIAELLAKLEMNARQVAVEVNLHLVPRAQHAQYALREADHLEVVSLVGGG
jgi:sulfur carrier protein